MSGGLRERLYDARTRLRRLERRELRYVRRRLEETSTVLRLSVVVLVPLLVGVLTFLSNRLPQLSFFLFPPLAAGAYSLFHDPEHEGASPVRFVGGLTAGALCAWLAISVALVVVYPDLPPARLQVDAAGAAFAVLLTAIVTWLFDVEEPAAYAVALLGLLVPPGRQFAFVTSVFVGSTLVAGVFDAWRRLFYERRATYLYESIKGDDHVLVPMRGPRAAATAMLAARLAAAHDAGKVVLLDVVSEGWMARAERARLEEHGTGDIETAEAVDAPADADPEAAVGDAAAELETQARRIESRTDVPCQVIVAAEGPTAAGTVFDAADQANCDLIAAPYEAEDGMLSPFARSLFDGRVDVLIHRSETGRTRWDDLLVPVRGASDVAHSMIDFAIRLAGDGGRVAVSHCIAARSRRRAANRMLEQLVEPFGGPVETRVTLAPLERFLTDSAADYDMVFVGASRDRSAASRLVSPPTFERLADLDADVAIVDRS